MTYGMKDKFFLESLVHLTTSVTQNIAPNGKVISKKSIVKNVERSSQVLIRGAIQALTFRELGIPRKILVGIAGLRT
jgi:hypothetical protein